MKVPARRRASLAVNEAPGATAGATQSSEPLHPATSEGRNLPPDPFASFGSFVVDVAAELVVHGDSAAGVRLAEQAEAWYESLSGSELHGLWNDYLKSLLLTAHWQKAANVVSQQCPNGSATDQGRVATFPIGLEGQACPAWSGVLAARLGDTATAQARSAAIPGAELSPRALQGFRAYGQAAIAAVLGQQDEAVEFLRQGFAHGLWFGSWVHRDPLLLPLRNHPGFKELIRPKG